MGGGGCFKKVGHAAGILACIGKWYNNSCKILQYFISFIFQHALVTIINDINRCNIVGGRAEYRIEKVPKILQLWWNRNTAANSEIEFLTNNSLFRVFVTLECSVMSRWSIHFGVDFRPTSNYSKILSYAIQPIQTKVHYFKKSL